MMDCQGSYTFTRKNGAEKYPANHIPVNHSLDLSHEGLQGYA